MFSGQHGLQSRPAPQGMSGMQQHQRHLDSAATGAPLSAAALQMSSFAGGMPLAPASAAPSQAPGQAPVPLAPALAYFQHHAESAPAPLAASPLASMALPPAPAVPISVVAHGGVNSPAALATNASSSASAMPMAPMNHPANFASDGNNVSRKRSVGGIVGGGADGNKNIGVASQIMQMRLGNVASGNPYSRGPVHAGPAASPPTAAGGSRSASTGGSPGVTPPAASKAPMASVPSHMLSRRPSLGIVLQPQTVPNSSAARAPSTVAASTPLVVQNRSQAAGESFWSATQAAAGAGAKLPPNNNSTSPAPQRRNSSTEAALRGQDRSVLEKPSSGAETEAKREGTPEAAQQQVSKKRKITCVHGGKTPDGRPSMKRSNSLPSVTSPQAFLDSLLKARGYSTASYCSLETGYYSKPTPHQKASYGLALVRAVRSSDGAKLSSMLSSGLSRNPCNAFGESLVHMVCRRGDHNLLKVMLDEGATLQVSDDFGRTPLHDACWTAEPSFECVDLVLSRDVRLLRVVDCRGSSPLSYVKKEHWSDWIDFLESRKDRYWKKRNVSKEGEEGPPKLAGVSPNGLPVQDPDDALELELAKAVSAGTMSPEEAIRRRKSVEGGASTSKGPSPTVSSGCDREGADKRKQHTSNRVASTGLVLSAAG